MIIAGTTVCVCCLKQTRIMERLYWYIDMICCRHMRQLLELTAPVARGFTGDARWITGGLYWYTVATYGSCCSRPHLFLAVSLEILAGTLEVFTAGKCGSCWSRPRPCARWNAWGTHQIVGGLQWYFAGGYGSCWSRPHPLLTGLLEVLTGTLEAFTDIH